MMRNFSNRALAVMLALFCGVACTRTATASLIPVAPVTITSLGHNFFTDPLSGTTIQDAVAFPSGMGTFTSSGFSASIATGDTIQMLFQAPAGEHFAITRSAQPISETFFSFAFWQAGGDSASTFVPLTITFQNPSGTAPVATFDNGTVSNAGKVVEEQLQMSVGGDFTFTALQLDFNVTNALLASLQSYGSVKSSSFPSLGVIANGGNGTHDEVLFRLAPNPVPEPGSALLLTSGSLLLGAYVGKRRRNP
jgi:hypothetical protein